MEILGPACKVDLFVGDAPCLAGLDCWIDEGCGHQSGFPGTYMRYNAGARGTTRKTTTVDELAAWTDPRDRDMEA